MIPNGRAMKDQQKTNSKKSRKRRRASCVIELKNHDGEICLLISRQRGDQFDMIPGGGVDRGEAPIIAAIREVNEETTLRTKAVMKLFDYESQYTRHIVFLHQVEEGPYEARDDVESLWLLPLSDCHRLDEYPQLSRSTKYILGEYIKWREGREAAMLLEG